VKKLLFPPAIVLFIVTQLFFTGCAGSKVTSVNSDEEKIEILPSDRLMNKLEANRRKIKNFEGSGVIKIKSERMDNSASFRTTVIKPDSIYLNILGPFSIDLAKILVTNKDFQFYDAIQNSVYKGEYNENILRNIFKIDLGFSDLIDAFVGSVNLTSKLYKSPDKFETVNDQYILTYIDPKTNYSTIYKIDIRELSIKEVQEIDASGNLVFKGKYSKFNMIETVAFPYLIEIENAKTNESLTIEYRKVSVNKNSAEIEFKVPNDSQIIEW
jgi:hypothetical protein